MSGSPPQGDAHYGTDQVRADLPGRSVRSGTLMLVTRGLQALLHVGAIAALARLLTPGDFGILAMVAPAIVLATMVMSSSLQSAVIHREELDHLVASRLFFRSAAANLGVTGLLFVSAPVMAAFYAEPLVIPVTLAWGTAVYLGSLTAIPEGLLKRQLRFTAVATASVGSFALGSGLAIAAALLGAGLGALVVQCTVSTVARGAWIWWVAGWRPAPRPGASGDPGGAGGVAALTAYWTGLSGFRGLEWAGSQVDRILVGFLGGPANLGLYDAARRWSWYPFMEPFLALTDVAVSSFSRAAGEPERYRAFVRRGLLAMAAIPLPAIAYLSADTENVVLVLLGDQWLGAVPFVRLMCAAAFFGSIRRLMSWLYLSQGQTSRQLRWGLIETPTVLAAIVVGTPWGVIGVAVAVAAVHVALTPPAVAYALRTSPVTVRDVLLALYRPVAASAGAGLLAVLSWPLLGPAAPWVEVLEHGAVFVFLYGGLWWALPGRSGGLRELRMAMRTFRGGSGPT